MARDTASPRGTCAWGPLPRRPGACAPGARRRRPAASPRTGRPGCESRVSLLKSGMSGAVAASSSIDLRISAVKRGERLGWPTMGALKCTSSDPESPALAATRRLSARRRRRAAGAARTPRRRSCRLRGPYPPRPPPPLDAGMQASRDGKHDPAPAYERSTRSNALAHADSSGASGASAPHRSSSFNTARSQWDDAVAFTCPSNTAKHDRKSPDLAASKSSASSSSAAPDAPAARARRAWLWRASRSADDRPSHKTRPAPRRTCPRPSGRTSERRMRWRPRASPRRPSRTHRERPPSRGQATRARRMSRRGLTECAHSREKAKSRAKGPREFSETEILTNVVSVALGKRAKQNLANDLQRSCRHNFGNTHVAPNRPRVLGTDVLVEGV